MNSNAQKSNNSFEKLTDSYFLNLLTGEPDSVIVPFLKQHFPYLLKKPEAGGWTMYPPGPPPKLFIGLRSVKFKRHPFINAKHSDARLDLITNEFFEGAAGIKSTRIWLYFEKETEAQAAIKEISKNFSNAGAEMITEEQRSGKVFKFTHVPERAFIPDEVRLVLITDIFTKKPLLGILLYEDDGAW
jgi:hypothetical protein